MTPKLCGDAYRAYWQERMAQGPMAAAHDGQDLDVQADAWWAALREALGDDPPYRVVELGSGYGRILQRMRRTWPEAYLFGYDLAPTAVDGAWRDARCMTLPMTGAPLTRADCQVTCTALQHITDDAILHEVLAALRRSATGGGRIAILENIAQPQVPHVRDMTVDAWRRVFAGQVEWRHERQVEWRGQAHAVLGGVWR